MRPALRTGRLAGLSATPTRGATRLNEAVTFGHEIELVRRRSRFRLRGIQSHWMFDQARTELSPADRQRARLQLVHERRRFLGRRLESPRGGLVGARVHLRGLRRGVVVLAQRDRSPGRALDLRRGFVNSRVGVLLALRARRRVFVRGLLGAAPGEYRGAEQRHGDEILRVPHRRVAFLCANVDTGHPISCVRAPKVDLAFAAVREGVARAVCVLGQPRDAQ